MKGESNWIYSILIFLAGCLSCYVCTQFEYFKLDYDVKVVETLLSLSTIIVGLYLGITINSRFNNKQHLINFIGPKLEETWLKVGDVNTVLINVTQIDNNTVSKKIRDVNASIAKLNQIFDTFKYEKKCIIELDNAIDALESKLYTAPITNDIIYYQTIKSDIVKLLKILDLRVVEAMNFLYSK